MAPDNTRSIGEVVQERERDLRALQEENLELKIIIYLLKSDLETRSIAHEADLNVLRTRLACENTTNKSLRWQIIEMNAAAHKDKNRYKHHIAQAVADIENDVQEVHRTTDRILHKLKQGGKEDTEKIN